MNNDISLMNRLLQEVAEHLAANSKAGKTAATEKLERIAAIATTLALTIRLSRQ